MSPGVQGLSVSKARSASIEVFGQHLWKLNLRHPTADHSQKTSPCGHSTDGKIESWGWTLAKATEQGRGQSQGFNSGLCDSESAPHPASEMGSARGVFSPRRKSGKKDTGFAPPVSDRCSQGSPCPGSWSHTSDSVLRDQAGQGSQTHRVWGQTGNIHKGRRPSVRPSG